MKLFDEKGRVFGLINIIDLLVIVAILLVGTLGFMKFGGKAITPVVNNSDEITFEVKAIGKQPYLASGLKIGQNIISAGNILKDASIVSVKTSPSDSQNGNSNGISVASKSPLLVDITVLIKAKINVNDPILKVGIQEIGVGTTYTIRTQTESLIGIISGIDMPKE